MFAFLFPHTSDLKGHLGKLVKSKDNLERYKIGCIYIMNFGTFMISRNFGKLNDFHDNSWTCAT